jgi:hypothetical protein
VLAPLASLCDSLRPPLTRVGIPGLGDTVTTTVTANADATALYACQNNGGNCITS